MAIPAALTQFDIQNAGLTVWLFKKSGGGAGTAPTYTGRWITTQADLDAALKASLIAARARITEVHEYGLLAQNNEASALLIDTVETHAGLIVAQSANPTVQKKVKSEKEVTNTSFFVVRLTDGDNVLLSVRKNRCLLEEQAAQSFYRHRLSRQRSGTGRGSELLVVQACRLLHRR